MMNMYCLGGLAAGKISTSPAHLSPFYKKTHFVFIANDSGFDAVYRLSELDNTVLFVSQLNQWVGWKLYLLSCCFRGKKSECKDVNN